MPCKDDSKDADSWYYEPSILKSINWKSFRGTSQQKEIFKYLVVRLKEIKDLNVRDTYFKIVNCALMAGSCKKDEYPKIFDKFVDAVAQDDKHIYILEGVQYFIEANIPQRKIFNEGDCSVCYEKLFVAGKSVKILLCNHAFHENCLNTWISQNKSCPLCREAIN